MLRKNLKTLKVVESGEVEPVSEEKVAEAHTEYEKKMAHFKKVDAINAQLAMLEEMSDMVQLSIDDLLGHIDVLESQFSKEIESKDPILGELYLKIESLKSKYKS